MKWSDKKFQEIQAVYDSGNTAEFGRLLKKNPLYTKWKDGTDAWMNSAATTGNLEFIQLLIDEVNLDVNLSKDLPDPTNPFNTVEGPIVHAAGEGHIDIVQFLLSKGANINYEVNGKVRCLPLLRACSGGHFEVVKLLVEHGADLHFSFNGHTPLSQAEKFGHKEIAEYLRFKGAKK